MSRSHLKIKNSSLSQLGVYFGLALAGASFLTALMGSILVWKVIDGENRADVQQSIGDTASIIATHFFDHFQRQISHISEATLTQIRPSLSNSTSKEGQVNTEPEIVNISLWKKGEQIGAFDLYPDPKRIYFAMNSRFIESGHESGQIAKQVQSFEAKEKILIMPAFQGHIVITKAPYSIEKDKELALIAAPLGRGVRDEVVVAHLVLDSLKDVFRKNGMVSPILVDDFGKVLVQSEFTENQTNLKNNKLFQVMHASNLESGQIIFSDAKDNQFFGGYSKVGLGQLSVLATIPEAEARAAVKALKKQIVLFIIGGILFFIGLGYLVSTQPEFKIFVNRELSGNILDTHSGEFENQTAKRLSLTILYGSLHHLNQIIDSQDPQSVADSLNDFFTLGQSNVKKYGGIFEKTSDKAFIGIWGAPQADGTEGWRALKCALDFRKDFYSMNEARKLDGLKILYSKMGLHTGVGIAARIGPLMQLKYTGAGEVLSCAKALYKNAFAHKTDLLVSQDTWQLSEGKFVGDLVGEAKLTPDTGLTSFFTISGYHNEEGQVVTVEASQISEAGESENSDTQISGQKILKWLVNNGSQIVGPFTAREIASRLFAQELDFDCECWAEGNGTSAQIKTAGIFTGSDGPSASLWMFDGEMIHGPISPGFVFTAVGHGAIPQQVYICEGSTISGWKSFDNWSKNLSSNQLPSDLPESSFKPPSRVKSQSLADSEDPEKKAA